MLQMKFHPCIFIHLCCILFQILPGCNKEPYYPTGRDTVFSLKRGKYQLLIGPHIPEKQIIGDYAFYGPDSNLAIITKIDDWKYKDKKLYMRDYAGSYWIFDSKTEEVTEYKTKNELPNEELKIFKKLRSHDGPDFASPTTD